MRVLFLVLYCARLRLGEALRLRLADVDLKQAAFGLPQVKGAPDWYRSVEIW
jgi:integrase